MAEATTRDIPSRRTSRVLTRATKAGEAAERAVVRFCGLARACLATFDAEVVPLQLPDEDYERVVSDSGLRRVIDSAERIGEAVASLHEERAA